MPIIRITRKQLEEANKAREAALAKDPHYRLHEERRSLVRDSLAAREREQVEVAKRARPVALTEDNPEDQLVNKPQRYMGDTAAAGKKEQPS